MSGVGVAAGSNNDMGDAVELGVTEGVRVGLGNAYAGRRLFWLAACEEKDGRLTKHKTSTPTNKGPVKRGIFRFNRVSIGALCALLPSFSTTLFVLAMAF